MDSKRSEELRLLSGQRRLRPHSTALGDAGQGGSEVRDPRVQGRQETPQKGARPGGSSGLVPSHPGCFSGKMRQPFPGSIPIHTGFLSVLSSQNLVQPCQHCDVQRCAPGIPRGE